MPSPSDPYSRLQYRRLIAWPSRIEREWPLLAALFERCSPRRLLDLGCGTGEHARFLGEKGFEVVGIDRGEKLIEEARREALENVTFVHADLTALDEIEDPFLTDGGFGGAICLGNTLPHILERDDLVRLAAGLSRLLAPGAPVLIQILNYERIHERHERHLPLNFRPQDDGGELVFLRLMEPRDDGSVVFCPTTLRFDPEAENPVEMVSSRRVPLMGWRRPELEEMLAATGFGECRAYGSIERDSYEAGSSQDLVLVARRV